jgi:aryl-alcohol dehydrogenase-like predicted oxidoreductase
MSTVAIAYLMQKTPYVFPVVGGRKVDNLLANAEGTQIALSEQQIEYLESILPFDPGYPNTMIVSTPSLNP